MEFQLSKEQAELKATVIEFAQKEIAPRAAQLDAQSEFPTQLFVRLGELGVTAVPFKEEDGGLGLGTLEMALVVEEIARADQSLAVTTMVSVATGLTLARFGSPEQKARWLPDIVAGQKICAIAGTEPQAGSDTAGFQTRARLDGNKWALNGEKAYITNAGTEISAFALVLCVTSPPDADKKTFTIFLVPNGTEGYATGPTYSKMGWRSSDTRPLHFDDCALTPDHVVGEVDGGRYILHKGYQQARVFLAACSLGLAQASLDHALAYANERAAFGGAIGRFQMVQDMIATMAVEVEAARMLVYRAAWMDDAGLASIKDLAFAKYYATEVGSRCADKAIQIHGGWGFMDDCPVSRYYRDNRICTIGDGSSQIQKLLIARDLGLPVEF